MQYSSIHMATWKQHMRKPNHLSRKDSDRFLSNGKKLFTYMYKQKV